MSTGDGGELGGTEAERWVKKWSIFKTPPPLMNRLGPNGTSSSVTLGVQAG